MNFVLVSIFSLFLSASRCPVLHLLQLQANGSAIQNELLYSYGQRTVPNVFLNGKHIGGCDKTLEAIENGTFKESYWS
jgi:glutaredoxin